MATLKIENVKKIYDNKVTAVDNFCLDVPEKEFIIFVGPSGCGKTTTLRMIAGLEEITEGKIYIDGKCVNDVAPKDRDIAMVFQNYALYPHMTVYDNIAFSLRMRKAAKEVVKTKVAEVAETLGLTEYLTRKPKQISGGQRQRVALGRAMVRNPKIFLLDEPLSNLDAKLRANMRTELIALYHSLDATFVYVTHDQVEAMTMGTRIVVMKDGVIQQIGSPQEIFDDPNNLFVASFIGTPQMNTKNGILRDGYVEIEQDKIPIIMTESKREYIGQKVVLGFRPTAVALSKDGVMQGVVEIVERLGAENNIYLRNSDKTIVVKSDSKIPIQIGEQTGISIPAEEALLFDAETEVRIR